jgi:hypothetical protein
VAVGPITRACSGRDRNLSHDVAINPSDDRSGQQTKTKKFPEKNEAELVPEAFGTRREMRDWEHQQMLEYRRPEWW